MANSKRKKASRKADGRVKADWRKALNLPPDFPLFIHGDRSQPDRLRWAKKVRGKLHYFGKVSTDTRGDKAAELWAEQKDDIIAGRPPRKPGEAAGVTVAGVCNHFLHAKKGLMESGEITARHWHELEAVAKRITAHFGRLRLVSSLTPSDFDSLRLSVAKTGGAHTVANFVQKVRSIFKYGFDADLIDRPVKFGPTFKKPSKKVMRVARAEKGPKMLDAADLRRLIDKAGVPLKAMILLGLNCGFGNSDCATLPLDALDLNGGWCNYHRGKTGIARRCALWAETIEALRGAIAKRPTPKSEDAEGLVFVTKYGAPWGKESVSKKGKVSVDNPITKGFRKLLEDAELHRPGIGFYTLRHVFRTVADSAGDTRAVRCIMGHTSGHVEEQYVEALPEDHRLQAVADHVHDWLYAEDEAADDGQPATIKLRAPKRPARARPTSKGAATAELATFSVFVG